MRSEVTEKTKAGVWKASAVSSRLHTSLTRTRTAAAGEIVEAEPSRRLVIRWQDQIRPELKAEGESHCTMEMESSGTASKPSITHTIEREPSNLIVLVSSSWPKVISNLKSMLETGSIVLQGPFPVKGAHSGKE